MDLLEIGQAAPDATLARRDGEAVRLSDFWRAQTTVFVFLRHFG
jgi:peroxiredoxin